MASCLRVIPENLAQRHKATKMERLRRSRCLSQTLHPAEGSTEPAARRNLFVPLCLCASKMQTQQNPRWRGGLTPGKNAGEGNRAGAGALLLAEARGCPCCERPEGGSCDPVRPWRMEQAGRAGSQSGPAGRFEPTRIPGLEALRAWPRLVPRLGPQCRPDGSTGAMHSARPDGWGI